MERTIERAELTAFFCLLTRIVGPTTAQVDNKGIIDGLWRGEVKCVGPQAKDADLWILVREEVSRIHQESMLLEVEHVKAHRSKKEKKDMALFGSLVTEGIERADELATGGCNAGGETAQIRVSTVQQKRKEVYATLQCAASFHCLVGEKAIVKRSGRCRKKSGSLWNKKKKG